MTSLAREMMSAFSRSPPSLLISGISSSGSGSSIGFAPGFTREICLFTASTIIAKQDCPKMATSQVPSFIAFDSFGKYNSPVAVVLS